MTYSEYIQTEEWAALREQALIRACYECEECGSPFRLQVHHIEYLSDWHSDNLDNLKVLCRKCHAWAHGIGLPAQPESVGISESVKAVMEAALLGPRHDLDRIKPIGYPREA